MGDSASIVADGLIGGTSTSSGVKYAGYSRGYREHRPRQRSQLARAGEGE